MQPTKKIGLISGDGDIPLLLVEAWKTQGITPIIVNLTGRTDFGDVCETSFSMGQVGHIVSYLKSHDVTDLVIIGKVSRPNFFKLRADITGFKLIAQLLMDKMTRGDDGLLKFVRRALEGYGFCIQSAQDFLPQLLCPEGVLTKIAPMAYEMTSISTGFSVAKTHGQMDKGQSVVLCDGTVSGVEGIEGTNYLIAHANAAGRKILIKVSKPQQDMALDAPTIGPATIKILSEHGFSGLVVEAESTLVIDKDIVLRLCNDADIFLVGTKDGHFST